MFQFFSDKCVHREIRALPLACQCLAWKGSFGEFCDDHREKCVSIMQLLQHSSSEKIVPQVYFFMRFILATDSFLEL